MRLRARVVKSLPDHDGPEADLKLIEPNGDAYLLRCRCRMDGSVEIGRVGLGDELNYLNRRYGIGEVCSVCREAIMLYRN
ncbi:MAG TPA: hypothetical protein VJ835_03670 [Fimbriimonadaceae bacterium]|nr:hypothetical protein [Fimbriimonadaceae bacterium]